MPDYRKETQEWIAKAKGGEHPYSQRFDHGVALLSVATALDGPISTRVEGRGLVVWRAVNERPTAVTKTLTVEVRPDPPIMCWEHHGRPVAPIPVELKISRSPKTATHYSESHASQEFAVERTGVVTVASLRWKGDTHPLESVIDVVVRQGPPGLSGGGAMPVDWLGLVATAIKNVPGGRLLIEPLLRVYDQQRVADFNQRVEALLRSNNELSADVLKNGLDLKVDTNGLKMALDAIAPAINEFHSARQGQRSARDLGVVFKSTAGLSQFPFPIEEGLFLRELINLFRDHVETFKGCLLAAGYVLRTTKTMPEEHIQVFVASLKGKSESELRLVIESLYKEQSGSEILNAANACLTKS